MKKKLSLLLAGIMTSAALLTGCGGNDESTANNNDNNSGTHSGGLTVKDGVLMVGMEIGYPPMEYLDTDGSTPIGFDVEFAGAIADYLGLELELVDTAWDGILASLDTNRYDCVISSLSITEERSANYNMTEAYIANRLCIVTSDTSITKPEDLAGKIVCAQTETTADYYIRDLQAEGLGITDFYVYDKVIQCFDELKFGRVDAVMVDSVVASYYIGEDSDTYKVVWEKEEGEPIGIGLKKGNDELTAKIEEAVDALYENGTFATIAAKYFGDSSVSVRD